MAQGPTQYSTTVPDMEDFNALKAQVDALEERVAALEGGGGETTPPPTLQPSPTGHFITTAGEPAIVDDALHQWGLVATAGKGQQIVYQASGSSERVIDPPSQFVVKLGIDEINGQRRVAQENQTGNRYYTTGTPPAHVWVQYSTGAGGAPAGAYFVHNGQLCDPSGKMINLRGVNICSVRVWGDKGVEHPRITRQKLQSLFPKCNFIRYAHWAGLLLDPADAAQKAWTDDMTSHGIIVMYDLHYTGNAIDPNDGTANNWLRRVGEVFGYNPMVWAQTQNEPHGSGHSISAMMKGQYNAFRSSGNKAPVFMCTGNPGGECTGMNGADFADMTNACFDGHYYGWMPQNGISYQQCLHELSGFHSRDGAIPVACLEYGDSTDGNSIDGNWQTVLDQALAHPQGCAAWMINWITATSTTGDCLVKDYNMSGRTPYGDYVNARL